MMFRFDLFIGTNKDMEKQCVFCKWMLQQK